MARYIKVNVGCSNCWKKAVFEGDRDTVYDQKTRFDHEHLHGGCLSRTMWEEEEA